MKKKQKIANVNMVFHQGGGIDSNQKEAIDFVDAARNLC